MLVAVFGGVAEWFKAAVLKTVERKFRGFESYLLRHFIKKERQRRDDREAEGARLLSVCGGNTPPRVRIPLSPPSFLKPVNLSKVCGLFFVLAFLPPHIFTAGHGSCSFNLLVILDDTLGIVQSPC